MAQQENTGFRDLLNQMMTRRWNMTLIVLLTFMGTVFGIGGAIVLKAEITGAWKELLLLLLGAFIGSYGKIVDYWFSDTDKDKMLVQKMDEEDGISLSNTNDKDGESTPSYSPIVPESFTQAISNTEESVVLLPKTEEKQTKVEIDEDGDGTIDGYDIDGDGVIDEYFDHRNCQHVWGDSDGDGDEECLICGKIKDIDTTDMEG